MTSMNRADRISSTLARTKHSSKHQTTATRATQTGHVMRKSHVTTSHVMIRSLSLSHVQRRLHLPRTRRTCHQLGDPPQRADNTRLLAWDRYLAAGHRSHWTDHSMSQELHNTSLDSEDLRTHSRDPSINQDHPHTDPDTHEDLRSPWTSPWTSRRREPIHADRRNHWIELRTSGMTTGRLRHTAAPRRSLWTTWAAPGRAAERQWTDHWTEMTTRWPLSLLEVRRQSPVNHTRNPQRTDVPVITSTLTSDLLTYLLTYHNCYVRSTLLSLSVLATDWLQRLLYWCVFPTHLMTHYNIVGFVLLMCDCHVILNAYYYYYYY